MRMLSRLSMLALVIALTPPAPAARMNIDTSASEPIIAPVTTHHMITVDGHAINYDATFYERLLSAPDGTAQATISSTAYVRDGIADEARRPVTFVFNGGPGASSSPLHFNAMGPRMRAPAGPGMIDNPETPLDRTDLVFIDPVGTGFSRVMPSGNGKPYWSIAGDATAVLGLIRAWLADHHRTSSPIYIAGESYGGTRLAAMLHDARDLPVAGMIFISPALTIGHGSDGDLKIRVELALDGRCGGAERQGGCRRPLDRPDIRGCSRLRAGRLRARPASGQPDRRCD